MFPRPHRSCDRSECRFETRAGLFSHAHADEGSELLASRLPTDFDGNAADFGAGWGYLSAEVLARCSGGVVGHRQVSDAYLLTAAMRAGSASVMALDEALFDS